MSELQLARHAAGLLAENETMKDRVAELEVLLDDAAFYVGIYTRNPKAEAIADDLLRRIRAALPQGALA